MRSFTRRLLSAFVCALCLSGAISPLVAKTDGSNAESKSDKLAMARSMMKNQKIVFIENKGQILDSKGRECPDIKYVANMGNITMYFMKDRISYVLQDQKAIADMRDPVSAAKNNAQRSIPVCRVDMELIGSNPDAALLGQEQGAGQFNYYHKIKDGDGVQSIGYKKLVYRNVYKNIDLAFYPTESGMKYDYIVHPGGNPDLIHWKYSGNDGLSLTADGKLRINTSLGALEEDTPVSYQDKGKEVKSSYLLKDGVAGFDVRDYNAKKTLVIDPRIVWATYYGSNIPAPDNDYFTSVDVDVLGRITAVGYTESNIFPVAAGVQMVSGGSIDAVIVKLTPIGTLMWATYYGGNLADFAMGVAIDPATTDILVTGFTDGGTFPTTPGVPHPAPLGGVDAFMLRLPPGGGVVTWASFFGGAGDDFGMDIIVNSATSNPGITGFTNSPVFLDLVNPLPTGGVLNLGCSFTNFDAFIVECNSIGTLVTFGTYIGGETNDYGMGIIVDDSNNDYTIDGYTEGPDPLGCNVGYPTSATIPGLPLSLQPLYGGGINDGFVSRLSVGPPSALTWSTYLGGTDDDRLMDLARHTILAQIALTGYSNSPSMPAVPCVPNLHLPSYDALSIVLDYPNCAPVAGRYFGGTQDDYGHDVDVAPDFGVVITGTTKSTDFETYEPFQPNSKSIIISPLEAFVTKFDPVGCNMLWSSYYGSIGNDEGNGVIVDATNRVIAVGASSGNNLDLRNQIMGYQAGYDGYVVMIENTGKFPTFIGGMSNDQVNDIASDANSNLIITGYTMSGGAIPFPTTAGAHQVALNGAQDAFVSKFDGNGNLLWSTYYGGNKTDEGKGVAVDNSNNIYITGVTGSASNTGINTPGAQQVAFGGFFDAFVAKFNSAGILQWGTYLGGAGFDAGQKVAIDMANTMVYVTGFTGSTTNIATAGTQQPVFGGGMATHDAFIVKYNSAGVRQWGSYLGGTGDDRGLDIAMELGTTNVLISGQVDAGFAPYDIYCATCGTLYASTDVDVLVAKFFSNGTSPWAIKHGGAGTDVGNSITSHSMPNGTVVSYVTGTTVSATFPVSTPYVLGGAKVMFVINVNSIGARLISEVFIGTNGGSSTDANAITSHNGNIYVVGETNDTRIASTQIPGGSINHPAPVVINGLSSAFIMRIDPLSVDIINGQYFDANAQDAMTGVTGNRFDRVATCGFTNSANFNLVQPAISTFWSYQPTNNGANTNDGFIARYLTDLTGYAKPAVHEQPLPAAAPATATFSIQPNPAEDHVTVAGDAQSNQSMTITVSDLLGNKLMSIEGQTGAGRYSRDLNTSELAPGVYIVTVKTGQTTSSLKLIKQ